jgi:hypothetical protein
MNYELMRYRGWEMLKNCFILETFFLLRRDNILCSRWCVMIVENFEIIIYVRIWFGTNYFQSTPTLAFASKRIKSFINELLSNPFVTIRRKIQPICPLISVGRPTHISTHRFINFLLFSCSCHIYSVGDASKKS